MTTLRVLLHVAAQRDYELHSLDFCTAFLQGSLHEEIWLRRPPGFTGSFPTGTHWSIRRPVYGLRQAPREWDDTLRTTLAALGFVPSTADPSLFLRTDTSLPPFYVLVYVDDLVFAIADTEALTLVRSELQKRHTCTDLGELRSYLGLQITRDRARRTITLTQSHMVHQVLQRFGFQYSSLSAPPSDESVEPCGPYPELVGCLITSGMGLVLGGRVPVIVTGHADTSWLSVLLVATVAPLSLRGVPLSPFSPLLLMLLLSTSLALRRSGLRKLPVGGATTARARGAWVVEGTARVAANVVEEAEGVAVEVGVVPGVGASVAAVEVVEAAAEVVEAAAAVVEAAAAVVEVAAAVVLVEVQPRSVEALVVANASSSRVPVRPCRPSSFVSGTLGVGGLGVLNVAIFDLDFDAILAAMYAVTDSAEGDCYLCVPPDPGIEAAALGASASAAPGTGESAAPGTSESAAPSADESSLSGTAPTEALHTFTLDFGASRSFFCNSTTLTPLSQPVAVSLADPSGGPVLAHSSTVLLCLAAPSGLLSGLQLPSFSMNLVSGADLRDAWVDQFTPGDQRMTHCTCSPTGRHLATFTCRPGSSLYTLTTASPPVTTSSQVAVSSQVYFAASRLVLSMASCTLVSGLPRTLPPLPSEPAPTNVLCVEGRQRAAPHSPTFPPTEAPLQTLHMDVWGPARVRGQGHERYFLLVVDDYSRYTTVFPLRSKDKVTEINLQPRVSLSETTPTLRWTGKVGDASVFRVWGSRAFVSDTSADKLSSRAVPCVFLGFPPDAPGWQFYHPTSRCVLSSQDVTFVESVSYYHAFPSQGLAPSGVSQVDPAEPVEVAVDLARGAEPSGAGTGGSEPGVSMSEGAEPGGAEPECVEPGGAESGSAEPGDAELERAASGGLLGWNARRCRCVAGAAGVPGAGGAAGGAAGGGVAGAAGAGGAAGAAGGATCAGAAGGASGAAGGVGAVGLGGARTGGTGAAGAGGAVAVRAVGAVAIATGGAAGAGAVGAGAVTTGGSAGAGAVGARVVATGGATGVGAAGGT
ncbi:unnamed protein product [Closterium sp. NIES-54]